MGGVCASESTAGSNGSTKMTTQATVIATNAVVAFFLLALNFTVKTPLWKWRWVTGSILALAFLLLVVSYIVVARK